MIHGYTIAINSTNNCNRVPLSHLHYVQYPQKSSTVKVDILWNLQFSEHSVRILELILISYKRYENLESQLFERKCNLLFSM